MEGLMLKIVIYFRGLCQGASLIQTARALSKASDEYKDCCLERVCIACIQELKHKTEHVGGADLRFSYDDFDPSMKLPEFIKSAVTYYGKWKCNKKLDERLCKIITSGEFIDISEKFDVARRIRISISRINNFHKEAVWIYGFAEGYGLGKLKKAIRLANELHHGQFRLDGRFYIEHPTEVCRYLINLGVRVDALLAALMLHDSVEDVLLSKFTKEAIANGAQNLEKVALKKAYYYLKDRVGEEAASLVLLLTKRKGETEEKYKARYSRTIGSVLAKGGDKASNIGDMIRSYGTEKLEEHSEEAIDGILKVMKEFRNSDPEYGNVLIALRDRMVAVLLVIKEVIKHRKEIDRLKTKIKQQQALITELESK